jgi:hypothetical protein
LLPIVKSCILDYLLGQEMSQITINGTTYSLAHLASELIAGVPMMDHAGLEFKRHVFVVYSCHCYTIGEKAGIPFNVPANEVIWDGRFRRKFCPQRHGLSLILPGVVRQLLFSPHAHVWDTGVGNRHYHELIATPNMAAAQPYYLFMRIERQKLEDGPHVIKMTVESAYLIQPPDPSPRARDPLRMSEWLGKTWAPPTLGVLKNKNKRKK